MKDHLFGKGKFLVDWFRGTRYGGQEQTSTNEDIEKLIREELLTGRNKVSDNYAGASAYLAYRGIDLAIALKLADKAKELDKNSEWIHGIKV